MTAPQNRSSSAGDDDSWGKLASDLFGINLSADEDLDLSDLEPPPPPAPIPVAPPPPAPPVPTIDLSDMDFQADEDDEEDEDEHDVAEELDDEEVAELDEAEVDDAEIADEDLADQPEPVAEADDFWDVLESWDWEKGDESAAAMGESTVRPRRPEERSRRGPRDRDQSRGRGGSSSGRRESREDRPPRSSSDQPRSARSENRDEPPRRERRPAAERPLRGTGNVPPSPPRQERQPQFNDDDFGAGLVGGSSEPLQRPDAPHRSRPSRPEPRTPAPVPDDEDLIDDHDVELSAEGETDSATDGGTDEPTRRRRRRRRRRRPAENREDQSAPTPVSDEDISPQAEDEFTDAKEDDLDFGALPEAGDEEPRTEPRSRRRRRRRPGDRPARNSVGAKGEDSGRAASDAPQADDDLISEDEAAVPAVNYDDVPTWEEAISYLVKSTSGGGRDGGGYRSGPRRR